MFPLLLGNVVKWSSSLIRHPRGREVKNVIPSAQYILIFYCTCYLNLFFMGTGMGDEGVDIYVTPFQKLDSSECS